MHFSCTTYIGIHLHAYASGTNSQWDVYDEHAGQCLLARADRVTKGLGYAVGILQHEFAVIILTAEASVRSSNCDIGDNRHHSAGVALDLHLNRCCL